MAPASSWETSSRALSRRVVDTETASISSTNLIVSGASTFCLNASMYICIALNGCLKSWLAEAKNTDLARLALSATLIALARSSPWFHKSCLRRLKLRPILPNSSWRRIIDISNSDSSTLCKGVKTFIVSVSCCNGLAIIFLTITNIIVNTRISANSMVKIIKPIATFCSKKAAVLVSWLTAVIIPSKSKKYLFVTTSMSDSWLSKSLELSAWGLFKSQDSTLTW